MLLAGSNREKTRLSDPPRVVLCFCSGCDFSPGQLPALIPLSSLCRWEEGAGRGLGDMWVLWGSTG